MLIPTTETDRMTDDQ